MTSQWGPLASATAVAWRRSPASDHHIAPELRYETGHFFRKPASGRQGSTSPSGPSLFLQPPPPPALRSDRASPARSHLTPGTESPPAGDPTWVARGPRGIGREPPRSNAATRRRRRHPPAANLTHRPPHRTSSGHLRTPTDPRSAGRSPTPLKATTRSPPAPVASPPRRDRRGATSRSTWKCGSAQGRRRADRCLNGATSRSTWK